MRVAGRQAAHRQNERQDKKFVPNTADKLLAINDGGNELDDVVEPRRRFRSE